MRVNTKGERYSVHAQSPLTHFVPSSIQQLLNWQCFLFSVQSTSEFSTPVPRDIMGCSEAQFIQQEQNILLFKCLNFSINQRKKNTGR
jgi:hypothetical protein